MTISMECVAMVVGMDILEHTAINVRLPILLNFQNFNSKWSQCNISFASACKEGYYGTNCSGFCSPNCKTCRHTDGFCTCMAGWMGHNCTTGISERE